jgi:hypothetical protein
MANRSLVCIRNETIYIYQYNHNFWNFFINEAPPSNFKFICSLKRSIYGLRINKSIIKISKSSSQR